MIHFIHQSRLNSRESTVPTIDHCQNLRIRSVFLFVVSVTLGNRIHEQVPLLLYTASTAAPRRFARVIAEPVCMAG